MSFIFSTLTVWGGDEDEIDNPLTTLVSVSYNRQPIVHRVNCCQEMGLLFNTRHCTGCKNTDAANPQGGPGWEHTSRSWRLLCIQSSSLWLSASGMCCWPPISLGLLLVRLRRRLGPGELAWFRLGQTSHGLPHCPVCIFRLGREGGGEVSTFKGCLCADTCVFEGVHMHTYAHVCRHTWDMWCVLTGFCVCIHKILI